MTFDMEDVLRSSAQVYEEEFPDAGKLRLVAAPCVVEDHKGDPAAKVHDVSGVCLGSNLENDAAPSDHSHPTVDDMLPGRTFHTLAAQVSMKLMYAARMARPTY